MFHAWFTSIQKPDMIIGGGKVVHEIATLTARPDMCRPKIFLHINLSSSIFDERSRINEKSIFFHQLILWEDCNIPFLFRDKPA